VSRAGHAVRRLLGKIAHGISYMGVCYGYMPAQRWWPDEPADASGWPRGGIVLDEPPPGHPEQLEPAVRPHAVRRPARRRRTS
jgi:hypothetical protein